VRKNKDGVMEMEMDNGNGNGKRDATFLRALNDSQIIRISRQKKPSARFMPSTLDGDEANGIGPGDTVMMPTTFSDTLNRRSTIY